MAIMVDNEFIAANKGKNGHDPWFALQRDEVPWLADMGERPATLDAIELREALMSFFMDFAHTESSERGSAQLDAARARGCRSIPYALREQTGVTPYVHKDGTRPPSLRRLYKKHPYFTNGSAADLDDILRRVGYTSDAFWHDGAPSDARRLTEDEQRSLLAFLDLL